MITIVEDEYTSLRQYCETRVDGRALQGDGADDRIRGSGARDLLRGGGGDDRLSGGNRGDCLQAQSGDDTVLGGNGADEIDAGAGDDTVRAADRSADQIGCGAGSDLALVDRRDRVAADCERRRVR